MEIDSLLRWTAKKSELWNLRWASSRRVKWPGWCCRKVSEAMDHTEPGRDAGTGFFTKTRETRKGRFGASLEKPGSRDLRLREQQGF